MSKPRSLASRSIETGKKLNTKEAATYLGIGEPTLRKHLRRQRLPFFKIGGRVVLDQNDLEAFLSACRVEPHQ